MINRKRHRVISLAVCLVQLSASAWRPIFGSQAVLPDDGVQWEFPTDGERVIAIGDLHGEFNGFVTVLIRLGLIDEEGNWTAGRAQLVLIGDLNDRGPDTRLLMDLVERLEHQASRAGGKVHTLFGNHELEVIRGRTMYSSAGERKDFADVAPVMAPNGKVDEARSLTNAFRGDTIYARSIRSRNALLKIGDTLFVHGGLGEWANQFSPGEINATIRAWTRYYQGVGPKPGANTNWVMGYSGDGIPNPWDTGPLWSTIFSEKLRESLGTRIREIRSILARMGVKRVVVGHITTADNEVLIEHPRYGDAVVMIDTGISGDYRPGRLSAIEISAEGVIARYFERPKGDVSLRKKELERRSSVCHPERIDS